MDDQVAEDDTYSDDDLDALPADAFYKLQEDAFRATQHQAGQGLYPRPGPGLANTAAGESIKPFSRPGAGSENATYQMGIHHPSSDYGDFEDDMLDGEIFDGAEQIGGSHQRYQHDPPGESTQREQWRMQRYSRPALVPGSRVLQQIPPREINGNARHTNQSSRVADKALPAKQQYVPSAKGPVSETVDVDSLQRQVEQLLREREILQRAVKTANDDVFAKNGEIAIVRANAVKAQKDLEGKAKTLQKFHLDEGAKHRIEIERARAEVRKLATEKEFLENDLAVGAKQMKKLQGVAKKSNDPGLVPKVGRVASPATTPKKSKLSYGDGFDDAEIQPLSPSELVIRGKGATPKAGAKRKRKVNEASPVKPLELAQPTRNESFDGAEAFPSDTERPEQQPMVHQTRSGSDTRYEFIQKLLRHRMGPGQERSIEALAKFELPSQRGNSMATLLYDQILVLGCGSSEGLPAAVALAVISLWSQCLREQYHDPVHLLADYVKYILLLSPFKTAPELTNSLMELVQETADIVVIPRCQRKPPRSDAAQISSTDCLEIIQLMSQDCSTDAEENVRFWRTMRFDFIMMLLSFVHPVDEIRSTVTLLQSSVLDKSFAMIIPPGDGKQDATEARVIDNLSRLLVENPRPTQGERPLSAVQLSELRLEILDLMEIMCERPYAAEALARHRLAVGRLVRVMNDELDRAYDYTPGHDLQIELVNNATRLLYRLTHRYADTINMQAKLSVIPGGEKKYLVALTRLAFSEGGYLEEGIDDDVVEQAHQMLEMRVSPEEAEQLVEAFASAQSTRRESRD